MANNIRIEIEITEDNRDAILKATEEQIEIALKAVGSSIERNASINAPVDTGFLRNSITYALDGESPNITTYHADKDRDGKQSWGSYSGVAEKESSGKRSVIVGSNLPYARKMGFQRVTFPTQ